MFKPLNHISGTYNFVCKECGASNTFDVKKFASNSEYTADSTERNMGEEVEHTYSGTISCSNCGFENDVEVSVYEYPTGGFNHFGVQVNGR